MVAPVLDFKTVEVTPSAVTSVVGNTVIAVVWGALPIALKVIVATVPIPFLPVPVGGIPKAYEIVPFTASTFLRSATGLSKKDPTGEVMSTLANAFGSYESSSSTAVTLFSPVSITTSTDADGEEVATFNTLGKRDSVVCARTGVG